MARSEGLIYPRRLSGKRTELLKRQALDPVALRDRRWWVRLVHWRQRRKEVGSPTRLGCPPALNLSELPIIQAALVGDASKEGEALKDQPSAASTAGGPYGICLSGGGIRSASYCLGVLQELHRHGMLQGPEKADYLSSVSGGSYIAGAFAMVNRGQYTNELPDKSDPRRGTMPAVKPESLTTFAPGSPEERYLRDHIRYLTHGQGGILGAVWRLLLGVSWNVLILTFTVAAFAVPIGWAYGAAVPSLRFRCPRGCGPHHFAFPTWVFVIAVIGGVLGLIAGMLWVGVPWRKEGTRRTLFGVSVGLLGVGAFWMLAVVAVPLLLEWIRASGAPTRRACRYLPTTRRGPLAQSPERAR